MLIIIMEYKRIEGETPSGGDYSEIWYLDAQGNVVDDQYAARCSINECKKRWNPDSFNNRFH